jgi:hypothetical protein
MVASMFSFAGRYRERGLATDCLAAFVLRIELTSARARRLSALSDVTMVDSKLESGLSTSIERFNFFFGVIIFWGSGESISCPSRKNSGLMGGLDISFLSYS